MKKTFIYLVLSSILLAACSGAPAQENTSNEDRNQEAEVEEQTSFTIGFIPSEKAAELTPKAERLGNFLEKEMGMEVEVVVPTDYEPLIEGLKFNHLDAAFMDSGPAYLATTKADAEVVLAELKNGSPFYYGEVFVASDNEEINSLDDAVGKKIAFTSWTGSSGFIFPIGTMVDRGLISPEGEDFVALEKAIAETFESYHVAGGYKQALDLLIEGKVDLAAGAHDAAEKYLEEEDQDKIKTIERLGKVPSHPVVTSSELSDEVEEKFVAAMMKLNEEENQKSLKDLYGVDGLVETTTEEHLSDFGPIFEGLTGVHDKVFEKHKN